MQVHRQHGDYLLDQCLMQSFPTSEGNLLQFRRHTPCSPVRDGLGAGLGSVRRLMDEVEVRSYRSVGTTVIARKHLRERTG